MRQVEHAPEGDAGTVTMGAVRVGARMMLEVMVHAAVLRRLPWYRGRMGVAILMTPYGDGQMDIERAGVDGPYRLRARLTDRLDKLPPVQLRVPGLPDVTMQEHAAEPVIHQVYPTRLVVTLPFWARNTTQPRLLHAVAS